MKIDISFINNGSWKVDHLCSVTRLKQTKAVSDMSCESSAVSRLS